MENRLRLKISKLFQTCRSKTTSDVSGDPLFFPENQHHRKLIALFSPKPQNPKISDKTPSGRQQKTTKKKPRHRKPKKTEYISSITDNYYHDWRSSDDEDDIDDQTTLFSTRSFPSELSESFLKNRANRKSEKKSKSKRRIDSGKVVKYSFAAAKKSSNPHEDFRVSMVEMIVEKRIFGAEELTNLFECFIWLNSVEHHRVIFEVFSEILEALFSGSD